jgi:hypothetical protein
MRAPERRGSRPAQAARWLLSVGLPGGVACQRVAPAGAPTPTADSMIPTKVDVQVEAIGEEPEQLVLDAGRAVQVLVHNEGDEACNFYVGEYLGDLTVPAGGKDQMSFTVPNLPGEPTTEHSTTTFGCSGDPARQGNVVVMPRPDA